MTSLCINLQVIEKYTRNITPASPSEAEEKTQTEKETVREAPTEGEDQEPLKTSTVIAAADVRPKLV